VRERFNNIIYNNSSSSQLNKYYLEANVDILKKIITNKLKKQPFELLGKQRRDRQKHLQEVTKDCINNFQTLSKVYFKQVGDEYMMAEFAELVSDNMVKELENSVRQSKRNSHSVNHAKLIDKDGKSDKLADGEAGKRRSSVVQLGASMPFKINPIKKLVNAKPPENPLADIKSQISNIEEFINSYTKSEEEINTRRQDIVKLEEEKKVLFLKIQSLQHQIVHLHVT
jgi:hypothetical protein